MEIVFGACACCSQPFEGQTNVELLAMIHQKIRIFFQIRKLFVRFSCLRSASAAFICSSPSLRLRRISRLQRSWFINGMPIRRYRYTCFCSSPIPFHCSPKRCDTRSKNVIVCDSRSIAFHFHSIIPFFSKLRCELCENFRCERSQIRNNRAPIANARAKGTSVNFTLLVSEIGLTVNVSRIAKCFSEWFAFEQIQPHYGNLMFAFSVRKFFESPVRSATNELDRIRNGLKFRLATRGSDEKSGEKNPRENVY